MPNTQPKPWILALGTSAALLLASGGDVQADVFPDSPFNGMTITYSVSGATVEKHEDIPGFTTSRSLSGKLGSSRLRVTGSAGMGNGYSADLTVTVSVADKTDRFEVNIPSGFPGMNTEAFDVSVPISDDATSGSISVSMAGHYNAGGRGLVVSGTFTREAKPKGGGGGRRWPFGSAGDDGEGADERDTKPTATPTPRRELPVSGTLEVTQELSPPRRIISFSPSKPIESLIGQGSAIHRLVLTVTGLPLEAAAAVVAGFEVDPPSRITGPSRRLRLDGGKAVTTFVFKPSEAAGQGGMIFGRARFPATVRETEEGWVASEHLQMATVKIRPICSRGSSIYYNDELLSDITYDSDALRREFLDAIARYGKDRVTATHYNSAGLGWFLAHPGGKSEVLFGWALTVQHYTGQEIALHRHVIAAGAQKRLTPGQFFHKALELNGGDMTKALLTCHNVLRAASGRGGESFPKTGLTQEERDLLTRKGLTREEMTKREQVLLSGGEYSDKRIFDSLVPLRPGTDNAGAWYHLMGTATMSLSAQSPELDDLHLPVSTAPPGPRVALDAVVWGEEYVQSGDIYSDPNEYCIDHEGLELGDALRSTLDQHRMQRWLERARDRRLAARQGAPAGAGMPPRLIEVRCPVTSTITDPATGRSFRLDQATGEVEDDLTLGFGLIPEGEYFGLVAVLPPGPLELRFEAVAAGRFSVTLYDGAQRQATTFEEVPVAPGATLGLALSGSGTPVRRDDLGTEWPEPLIREVAIEDVERVRGAAREQAIARGGFAGGRDGAVRDLSADGLATSPTVAEAPARRGARWGWVIAILLVVALLGGGALAVAAVAFVVLRKRGGTGTGTGTLAPLVSGVEWTGPDGAARITPLSRGRLTMGRGEDNDLVLADVEVSGHHAAIETIGGQITVRDLGSSNGTFLNGLRVQVAVVGPGDRVRVGQTTLLLR